jgi:hypothetical protein
MKKTINKGLTNQEEKTQKRRTSKENSRSRGDQKATNEDEMKSGREKKGVQLK